MLKWADDDSSAGCEDTTWVETENLNYDTKEYMMINERKGDTSTRDLDFQKWMRN